MNNKLALTAIVIYNKQAKNELLPKTLKSLERASQIVLFDVGSKSIEDFSHVRNLALKQALQPYVFFVDADEVVSNSSWKEIAQIVQEGRVDLVSVLRSDYFLGREMKGGEAGQQRLVRMGKVGAVNFVRPVHEVIEVLPSHNLFLSQIQLFHFSHPNLADFLGKVAYYARIEAGLRQETDQLYLLLAMLTYPWLKFIWNFIFRAGFRDGARGFVYALLMSLHSLFVRVYGWELLQRKVVR